MLTISITADAGSMRKTLDEAMATLGFIREVERTVMGLAMTGTSLSSQDEDDSRSPADQETPLSAAPTAKRERGKPSPGRQRRTKEEVAEDTAADAADAAAGHTEAQPQISLNPENRVGPEDSPEVQAQDAADEKAESDALKGGQLTLDDVREAVGRYYKKFGMGPATADIQAIFGCKLIDIPDSQDAFAKAVKAVDAATENNPYGRSVIGAEPKDAAPVATIDNLKAVMGRYIKKFGEPEGFADLPKILFVDNIVRDLPNDPLVYAKKIRDVEAAIEANPFDRKVLS